MKLWHRIALVASAAVVLAGLVWQAVRSREPVYQGRTFSAWLERYYQRVSAGTPLPGQDEIVWDENAAAIRQIGTNRIPYLLKLISAQDSEVKRLTLRYLLKPAKVMEIFGHMFGPQSWFPQWQ